MKISLYNLYKQVILEAVDLHSVQNALNGNFGVNIVYVKKDGEGNPTRDSSNTPRWCQVLAIGKTSKGNDAVRVYQITGPNIRTNSKGEEERYKTFLLNNINPEDWRPTKKIFYSPPDGLFNTFGDKTLNITDATGNNIAQFGDKYMDNYRERHAKWQSNLKTRQQNKPLEKGRADSEHNPNTDYEYTPYEKPQANQVTDEPRVNNQPDYQDDEDNPNDENI
jgi:DNA-binding ferritin-like protein (Dps family)